MCSTDPAADNVMKRIRSGITCSPSPETSVPRTPGPRGSPAEDRFTHAADHVQFAVGGRGHRSKVTGFVRRPLHAVDEMNEALVLRVGGPAATEQEDERERCEPQQPLQLFDHTDSLDPTSAADPSGC